MKARRPACRSCGLSSTRAYRARNSARRSRPGPPVLAPVRRHDVTSAIARAAIWELYLRFRRLLREDEAMKNRLAAEIERLKQMLLARRHSCSCTSPTTDPENRPISLPSLVLVAFLDRLAGLGEGGRRLHPLSRLARGPALPQSARCTARRRQHRGRRLFAGIRSPAAP